MKLKTVAAILLAVLLLVIALPLARSVGRTDFDLEFPSFATLSSVDWWSMFRHDSAHTGYSTSPAPITSNVLWSYNIGNLIRSSSAVVDGKVYVGSQDNKVYCFNALTGTHIWNYTTGNYVPSSPAVADGKVYVGSTDHKVYCLDASTGAHIWNYTTGGSVESSPAVVGGKVYVGSNDWKIYCLDALTGLHIWSYPTSYGVWSSPAVADGKVYVGSGYGIYCLNALTGAYIWSYSIGLPNSYVESSPTVADGKVYFGSWDNKVYCFNALTGTHIWNYTTGGDVRSSPAVADGKMYVGSYDGKVYCLNPSTGKHIWNWTTTGSVYSSPAVADGKIYIGSDDNYLYCLNASTGLLIWSYPTGGDVRSSPAVADGKVYVGSYDKKVYAFGDPRTPTTISVQLSSYNVKVGDLVTVFGKLSNAATGIGIPSAPVKVYVGGSLVGTLTTNSTGWYKATGPVSTPGTYIIKVEYPGSPTYQPCSATAPPLTVLPPLYTTHMFFNFTPNPTSPGKTVTLRGIIVYVDASNNIHPIAGATLNLAYSLDYGQTWKSAGAITTEPNGLFQKTFTAPAVGVYFLKLSYAGTPSYAPVSSSTFLIVR